MYYVYIAECADKTLYTGITTDVERRFKEHQQKQGARYTRAKGITRILHTERCADRSMASKREAEIKRLSRQKKLALIAS
jgi:putative endonuclease